MTKLPLGHENLSIQDIAVIYKILDQVEIDRRQRKTNILRCLNPDEIKQVSGGISLQAKVKYDGQIKTVNDDMENSYFNAIYNRLKRARGL